MTLIEPTLLAAFGAMLFWGLGDFLIQHSTRKIGNLESLAFISIIGTLGLFPFVLPELPPKNPGLLLIIGAVTFLVSLVNFEALKQGKLSVVEVILGIELPITALLGFVFFGELISITQAALIFLILAGGATMAVDSFSFSRGLVTKLEKGATLAVITAVGMAAMNLVVATGSRRVSPIMAIWVPWLLMAAASLLLLWRGGRLDGLFREGARHGRLVLGMGVIDTLAWLLYATAVVKNGLAITTAITESYPAIALFLGVFVNRERIAKHQWLGAAIAILASALLAIM